MTADDVYSLINYISNKNQNGRVTVTEFHRIINDIGQNGYVAYLAGSLQSYTPGRPISRVELGQNSVVRQRLTPVIYGYVLNIDSQGKSPYPGDFMQVDSMYSIYGHRRIRYAQQNQVDSMYNSVIDPIATNPIYLIEDTGFQFYPETQWKAKMTYVRQPPRIVWGYSLDVHGRKVYSPSDSVDPVWDDVSMMEIIARALRAVGVNLQAAEVSQYATELKQVGQ